MAGCHEYLVELLHNLKDKQVEIKSDEESMNNSDNTENLGYLVEKYKASFDYVIQEVQAAVDRMSNAGTGFQGNENNNSNPSNQVNSSINNSNVNNPRGGKRSKHKTRKHKHRK